MGFRKSLVIQKSCQVTCLPLVTWDFCVTCDFQNPILTLYFCFYSLQYIPDHLDIGMEIMFSTILMLRLACSDCTVINVGKSKKETYQSTNQELKQWKIIYWKQTKIAILGGQLKLKKFSRENCHWEAGNTWIFISKLQG